MKPLKHKKYPFPKRLLTTSIIVTVLALIILGVCAYSTHKTLKYTIKHDLKLEQLRSSIMYLDEILTMSARMAVATGDPKWIERYYNYEPKLSRAIKDAIKLSPDLYEEGIIKKIDKANANLVEMEVRSFKFINSGEFNKAKELLFNDEYDRQKEIYYSGINELSQSLHSQISHHLLSKANRALYVLIGIAFVIILLVVSWIKVIKYLKIWEHKLTVDMNKISQKNKAISNIIIK